MSNLFGNKFFEIGMLASFDILGWFNLVETGGTKDLIVSLPLFC